MLLRRPRLADPAAVTTCGCATACGRDGRAA